MTRMDTQTQERLTKSAKAVIGLVNSGLTPTAALVKVASDNRLEPQHVRRVAEAFNVSRSLANHREKQGEARLDSFPLADADKALIELFPKTYATAGETQAVKAASAASCPVVPNYNELFARREKAASVDLSTPAPSPLPIDPIIKSRRMEKSASAWKLQLRAAENALSAASVDLPSLLTKAANAVRRNLHNVPFDRLERGLVQLYGQSAGVKLASLLWEATDAGHLGQKRASTYGNILQDYKLNPFNEIDAFVRASLEAHMKEAELRRVKEARPADPFVATTPAPASSSPGPVNDFATKYAWFDATKGVLDRTINGLTNVQDNVVYRNELAKAVNELEDPNQRDQTTAIQIKSMLQDLMLNDEVISRYDKEEVLDRFNELAKLAPQVATQPMLVRGILRRALAQGTVDPFEASQFANTNSTLQSNQAVNRDQLEAMLQDAETIRPDLVQERPRDHFKAVLNGSFGTSYATPELKLRAADLALRQREFAHRQSTDAARGQVDRSQHGDRMQLERQKMQSGDRQFAQGMQQRDEHLVQQQDSAQLQAQADRIFRGQQAADQQAHQTSLQENDQKFKQELHDQDITQDQMKFDAGERNKARAFRAGATQSEGYKPVTIEPF